jgi:hypothetical protein
VTGNGVLTEEIRLATGAIPGGILMLRAKVVEKTSIYRASVSWNTRIRMILFCTLVGARPVNSHGGRLTHSAAAGRDFADGESIEIHSHQGAVK